MQHYSVDLRRTRRFDAMQQQIDGFTIAAKLLGATVGFADPFDFHANDGGRYIACKIELFLPEDARTATLFSTFCEATQAVRAKGKKD